MGCFGSKNPEDGNLKLQDEIFVKIDRNGSGKITMDDLKAYFKEYADSYSKLFLSEVDFNKDGVVTRSEWFAYWEYIKLAGYDAKAIHKSLQKLQQGEVFFNFPRAASYQSSQPRDTLIGGIASKLQKDSTFPIKLEPTRETQYILP